MKKSIFLLVSLVFLFSCSKTDENTPLPRETAQLQLQFQFQENQVRLDNAGKVSTIPNGNAAQTPEFRAMSIHLIELVPSAATAVGSGVIIYQGEEINLGGDTAINFDEALVSDEGRIFKTLPLQDIPAGQYEFIRVSVAYQNYDIQFNLNNVPFVGDLMNQKGSIASFLGFNTYLGTVSVNTMALAINAAHRQGFWVFETELETPFENYNTIQSGTAPAGATTVVNPLAGISDIPEGSCLVTGKFTTPLVISAQAKNDLALTLSFSINRSFEWVDTNNNGALDFDVMTPSNNEPIVDMGVRGLIPTWQEK
ncbi:MAG: hypothetical protein AB8G15_02030 [Saprospiraceae bacterium]